MIIEVFGITINTETVKTITHIAIDGVRENRYCLEEEVKRSYKNVKDAIETGETRVTLDDMRKERFVRLINGKWYKTDEISVYDFLVKGGLQSRLDDLFKERSEAKHFISKIELLCGNVILFPCTVDKLKEEFYGAIKKTHGEQK